MFGETCPTTRAMIAFHLREAQEHLGQLVKDAQGDDPDFGELELRAGMAHVYAHLNRAWHLRRAPETEAAGPAPPCDGWTRFPTDLHPFA